jgi:hypothetical protein
LHRELLEARRQLANTSHVTQAAPDFRKESRHAASPVSRPVPVGPGF